MMRLLSNLRAWSRHLVQHRFLLSLGLCVACGIILQSYFPVHETDPILRLIALKRPTIYHALVWSYSLFLYSTPFLMLSILFSFLYVHFYRADVENSAGALPPYPDPHARTALSKQLRYSSCQAEKQDRRQAHVTKFVSPHKVSIVDSTLCPRLRRTRAEPTIIQRLFKESPVKTKCLNIMRDFVPEIALYSLCRTPCAPKFIDFRPNQTKHSLSKIACIR